MCIFHNWSEWKRVQGGYQDTYGGFVLWRTATVLGWGRYCLKCLKKQFKVD